MKLTKKIFVLSLACTAVALFAAGCTKKQAADAAPAASASGGKIIVYTSMKESLIASLKEDFLKKNPDVEMDYQSAGAGSLMSKIAAEKQAGHIVASVIWTSEVPDFYRMKADGILVQYKSKNAAEVNNPLVNTDDYFIPARLGTLGIVYNTQKITKAPTAWNDLKGPAFKDAFVIADPSLSGTAFVSVAMLQSAFGDDFFRDIRKNGASLGKGSGQVIDDTASGEMFGCLGVDYITFDKIGSGASLAMAYPKEVLMVPSPIAILKDVGDSLPAAQRFIDYLLTKDAQQVVANTGTLPVRNDVTVPAKYNLPTVADALAGGITVDYEKMMNEREERIASFKAIMTGK
jgi:iron(III) transport system substrate-binding protein